MLKYSVERTSDKGVWWVKVNGLRMYGFKTRKQARDFTPPERRGATLSKRVDGLIRALGMASVTLYVSHLHPHEQKVLSLSLAGNSQVSIAKMVGVSQPSVNYVLGRVCDRIQYLASRPKFDMTQFSTGLVSIIPPEDVGILVDFWTVGCQSSVAKKRCVSQGYVRHRILRSLKTLESHPHDSRISEYRDALYDLLARGNIMRKVIKAT